MKKEVIKLLTNWRTWVFLLAIVLAFVWIGVKTETQGVLVRASGAPAVGVEAGDIVVNLNNNEIKTLSDFYKALGTIKSKDIVDLTVRRGVSIFANDVKIYPFLAEERENKTYIGIDAIKVPFSNLKFGLEIEGGTKLLLKPEKELDDIEFENIIGVLSQRLNIYGLKEMPVTSIRDFSGNKYIRIELAGASEQEARNLLEKEGKFEAKISNDTVFTGDDVLSVCLSGVQCGLRLYPIFTKDESGREIISWRFSFQIDISQEGANRFANATDKLGLGECTPDQCVLNQTIDFYIDDVLLEEGSLHIVSDLKGKAEVSPAITGGGGTKTEAQKEMRRLQAMLQSRKLPVKLDIVKIESISPVLGKEFSNNILLVLLVVILAVEVCIFIRYRRLKIIFPILIVTLSEVIITIGVASAIGWVLDLASIAGVIAAVGTGLDDQVIITDEVLHGEGRESAIKKSIKKAFFIVIAVYVCSVATMIPLAFAGAGLLRGFAITTIIGISVGVFITRPFYADLIKLLLKKED